MPKIPLHLIYFFKILLFLLLTNLLIIAANELFTNAWALLNATRPNKRAAYSLLQAAADLGHVKAQAKLGWAYLLGSPFEQNITKSVEIFQELANKGDPDSQLV